ncbi:MAG: hypothetical protein AVDCRST_MAG89-468, partial [uncultured Gemmatimonadetes bacterium]
GVARDGGPSHAPRRVHAGRVRHGRVRRGDRPRGPGALRRSPVLRLVPGAGGDRRGVRLGSRAVGNAHPRDPPSPRIHRGRGCAGGLRLRGGRELQAPRGAAVRSPFLPLRRAAGRRGLGGGLRPLRRGEHRRARLPPAGRGGGAARRHAGVGAAPGAAGRRVLPVPGGFRCRARRSGCRPGPAARRVGVAARPLRRRRAGGAGVRRGAGGLVPRRGL